MKPFLEVLRLSTIVIVSGKAVGLLQRNYH
jgi:hypothetical protein